MRPIAEAAEALATADGLIFDVDDTLTTHGRLTPSAFAALGHLADAGVIAVAVTGRPLGWCDAMASMWPIALAVGENGAGWVWRDDKVLRRARFSVDDPGPKLRAIRDDIRSSTLEVDVASDQPARLYDLAYDVGEQKKLDARLVEELAARIEGHGARTTRSSVHLHAVVGQWDKAIGATRAIREVLDRDASRWIFVGDSGNDEAAFRHFKNSVGVANVRDAHLTHRPKWVTERERGEGFIELVELMLQARAQQ